MWPSPPGLGNIVISVGTRPLEVHTQGSCIPKVCNLQGSLLKVGTGEQEILGLNISVHQVAVVQEVHPYFRTRVQIVSLGKNTPASSVTVYGPRAVFTKQV